MKKAQTKVGIKFSDFEKSTKRILKLVHRDAAEFAKIGVMEEYVNGVEREFNEITSRLEALNNQKASVADKFVKSRNLKNSLGMVVNLIQFSLSAYDSRIKTFTDAKYYSLINSELLSMATMMLQAANALLPELEAKGMKAEVITNAMKDLKLFEEALQKVYQAVEFRKEDTTGRNDKVLECKRKISGLSRIGRRIWVNRDVVKYKQYFLNMSKASAMAADENVDVDQVVNSLEN